MESSSGTSLSLGRNTKDGGVQFSGTLVEGFSVLRQMTGLCLPKVAHRLVYAMCQTSAAGFADEVVLIENNDLG